jgi:hypothetical protein
MASMEREQWGRERKRSLEAPLRRGSERSRGRRTVGSGWLGRGRRGVAWSRHVDWRWGLARSSVGLLATRGLGKGDGRREMGAGGARAQEREEGGRKRVATAGRQGGRGVGAYGPPVGR